MRTRGLALVGALLATALAGCGGGSLTPSETSTTAGSAPNSLHRGELSARDIAIATRAAKDEQRRIIGRFVGATAREQRPGLLRVRLVWDSANFTHGGLPGGPPDGPRQALLFRVRIADGHVSGLGARYRDVGADSDETLLYGRWPDPAAS
jgi:hypothetical protein